MFLVLSLSDLVNIPMKVLTWGVSSATGAPNISFLQVATAEPVQEATVPYQQWRSYTIYFDIYLFSPNLRLEWTILERSTEADLISFLNWIQMESLLAKYNQTQNSELNTVNRRQKETVENTCKLFYFTQIQSKI